MKCSGSVQAFQTISSGASNTLVITSARGAALLFAMVVLHSPPRAQQLVEAREALVPEFEPELN
jgi:hypothetical protein